MRPYCLFRKAYGGGATICVRKREDVKREDGKTGRREDVKT